MIGLSFDLTVVAVSSIKGGNGLPTLPPFFGFLVDEDGAFLVDEDGAFLIYDTRLFED